MKKNPIYTILAVLFAVTMFVVSCTKEEPDVRIDPNFTTTQVYNIRADSATIDGFVVAGAGDVTERGVVYNTSTGPTTANNKVVYTGTATTATFSVILSGLHFTTTYFARAYIINSSGTVYGEEYTFTTLAAKPTVSTTVVTAITGISAMSGGNITIDGGSDISARGVCYSVNPHPTTDSLKTSDGTGTGIFTSTLTPLLGNTKYYARAYATNGAGTGYGEEVSFTTPVGLATVTTSAVTDITKVSAVAGGIVIQTGGANVQFKGIVWSTDPDPDMNDNVIAAGSGLGEYSVDITGLSTYTVYHVRAYAINSAGTSYGADVEFTTLADTRTWYIPGDYVVASYPGSSYLDWSPGDSPKVESTISDPDMLEGYVYMANASNSWKFATQPNWNGPNYGDDNNSGVLDPNAANNISSPMGYYKLNANAAALTYTAIATAWGVIGSATPNGWDGETALTYDPYTSTWKGGLHLTAAEFKFRANQSWDYNYGSNLNDGNLQAGGTNIPVTTEDDYYFTLDLSHPNVYTYTANRWGLIGSATPGGWADDSNMSWDAVNQAMTITVDLVIGEMKFRANDDWAINLGGTTDLLTQDGSNIAIAEDGNYTIKLYLAGTMHCTIVKN